MFVNDEWVCSVVMIDMLFVSVCVVCLIIFGNGWMYVYIMLIMGICCKFIRYCIIL